MRALPLKTDPAHSSVPVSEHDLEALSVLISEAEGLTGHVPAHRVAQHILKVTEGGDFAVRKSAMDALLRRVKSAGEESEHWSEKRALSLSAVGVREVVTAPRRTYGLQIRNFAELEGSCQCADFARNSLGLCKHLWWVLERGLGSAARVSLGKAPRPLLMWNPIRPLSGAAPWLERIFWTQSKMDPNLRRWFRRSGDAWAFDSERIGTADRRLALVKGLLDWNQQGRGSTPRTDLALLGLLHRERTFLETHRTPALSTAKVHRALGELKRKLFPYQEKGVHRFLKQGRLLLADDMGLGKTAQAIASCHTLFRTQQVQRGLIVVPAALKSQWLQEWNLFTSAPAAMVEGGPSDRHRQYKALRSGFLIINYEQVLKDLPELLRLQPQLVVLDEAQRIKNWETKTSTYVKQLQPAWRLVLSGTPLENRLTELASLMDWVDDLALEPKWRLDPWHAVRSDGTREVTGARNLSTLRARLEGPTLRRIRREVLEQLPPRTDTRVPVPWTPEQADAHAEFDQPIARLISSSRRRPLAQAEFLKLMSLLTQQRIICNGLAQRNFEELWPQLQGQKPTESTLRSLFTPKLSELRELISNLVLTQGRKVVVFSQWKRMLRLAEWATGDLLHEAGYRAVYFTGDEGQQRRTQNVVDLHDDPRTRVLFATDAGGVGLNLQRAASACIHLDLPWNPAVLEQRSGRIYRFGQLNPVEIYTLVSSEGLESHVESIVGDKKALFDGLFDGTTDGVSFEKGGSFLATVQRLVEPAALPESPDVLEESGTHATGLDVVDTTPEVPEPSPIARGSVKSSSGIPVIAGVKMTRLADGRVVLEAEPEAAAALAAMFEGMAAMLKQAVAVERD